MYLKKIEITAYIINTNKIGTFDCASHRIFPFTKLYVPDFL